MIIQTNTIIGDKPYVLTESDAGRYVVRNGVAYVSALDRAEYGRTYTEGDPIPDTDATVEDYETALGELGVGV